MRNFVNACWFAFKWGLLAALVAGVGVGLFYYSRLNDEIRRRVADKFAAGYPNLQIMVRSAQLIEGQGIEVRGVSISDPRLAGPPAELAYFDEILLCCNTNLQELLQHEPKFTRMIIRRPRIQALKLPDGTWSASQLLPIPKFSDKPAEMQIEGGQLIVFDPQHDPPTTYNLHDVNLNIKPIADEDGATDSWCEVHGSMAGDHLQRVEIDGHANRKTGALDVTGSVAGIDISPELMAVLPADYAAQIKLITPLRGQAGFGFHVHRDPAMPQPLQFELAGELTSGRYDDIRLPEALADLRAKFSADNRGLQITDLTAHNGKTTLQWNARVDGFSSNAPILVQGEAMHLRIGKNWENLFPPKLLEQWRKFLPEGEINVRDVRAEFDGTKWRLAAKVECLNVSFEYWKFPYRLEGGRGVLSLDFDPQTQQNRLTIDLQSFAGSRPVDIKGEFFNPGPLFTGWVTIAGNEMPFDQKLYAAVTVAQSKSSEVVRSLNPVGTFNVSVTTRRDDPNEQIMSQDADITLNRCSFNYDKFPYPVNNVVGNLKLLNGNWFFQNLQGVSHSGHITCQGNLTKAGDGFALQLEFGGTNVALDDELRDALPNRMQPLWNCLKPRGSFNLLSAKVDYSTSSRKLDVVTRTEPVPGTVSIEPTFFPYRLENLRGELEFHDDRAEFKNLRGSHMNTSVEANGFCQRESDGSWQLHFENLTTDPFRIDRDRELMTALPAKLRKVISQLNPTGLVSVKGMLDLWGKSPAVVANGTSASECNVRSAWRDLEFDMEAGTLHTGLDLQNIHGAATLNGEYDPVQPEGQHLMTRGYVNVDTLSWNQFNVSEIQGPIWVDDRQVLFGSLAEQPQPGRPARHLSAKGYGGILEADGKVLLEETPRYAIQAAVDNVDLKKFCGEALPGRQKVKGRLQAGVQLTGNAAGLHTLLGNGQVQLRDADIYQLPVMVALLKVLNFKPPDTTAFTKCDASFDLSGEHFALKKIEFVGDAISLGGTGEMNLNTDINLRLHSLLGRSDMQLDGWKKLMGGASEQIMQIQVTGTLADPHAKREAFPVINQALQSIQAGMQPERQLPPQGMRPTVGAGDASRR